MAKYCDEWLKYRGECVLVPSIVEKIGVICWPGGSVL